MDQTRRQGAGSVMWGRPVSCDAEAAPSRRSLATSSATEALDQSAVPQNRNAPVAVRRRREIVPDIEGRVAAPATVAGCSLGPLQARLRAASAGLAGK